MLRPGGESMMFPPISFSQLIGITPTGVYFADSRILCYAVTIMIENLVKTKYNLKAN